MIGSSKNNRENYQRKCFRRLEKETQVKFNRGLNGNWPSNNWALKSSLGRAETFAYFDRNAGETKAYYRCKPSRSWGDAHAGPNSF